MLMLCFRLMPIERCAFLDLEKTRDAIAVDQVTHALIVRETENVFEAPELPFTGRLS